MYNAEVLSKFPVVQHFPFGSLFSWEQDANAPPSTVSAHTTSQPASKSRSAGASTARPPPTQSTKAPWANPTHGASMAPMTAPWANAPPRPPAGMPQTKAPWARDSGQP